jgi:hypothetical protein
MDDLRRIEFAELVLHGVIKLAWDDGFVGLVDLRPFIAIGRVYTPLSDPEAFKAFFVDAHGFSLGWGDRDDPFVAFGADRLHALAHQQKELVANAV